MEGKQISLRLLMKETRLGIQNKHTINNITKKAFADRTQQNKRL